MRCPSSEKLKIVPTATRIGVFTKPLASASKDSPPMPSIEMVKSGKAIAEVVAVTELVTEVVEVIVEELV